MNQQSKKSFFSIVSAGLTVLIILLCSSQITYASGIRIVTDKPSDITQNTASLSGIIQHHEPIKIVSAAFIISHKPQDPEGQMYFVTPDSHITTTITHLKPGTSYYVQLMIFYRESASGQINCQYGNEVTFTTLPTSPTTQYLSKPVTETIGATTASFTTEYQVAVYQPIEAGFVYTPYHDMPSVEGDFKISEPITVTSGTITQQASALQVGVTYHVRSFVKVAYGGEIKTFYSQPVLYQVSDAAPPIVKTCGFFYQNGQTTSYGLLLSTSANVIQEGFVYSLSNHQPTLADSVYIAGKNDIHFDGTFSTQIPSDRTLYVRAYAINRAGIGYGDVSAIYAVNPPSSPANNTVQRKLSTLSASISTISLQTLLPSNVTSTTATAHGNISYLNGETILEKGFVYTSGAEEPTTRDLKVFNSSNTIGSFAMVIKKLEPLTTYSIRAYVVSESGIAYGPTKTFTTTSGYSDSPNVQTNANP